MYKGGVNLKYNLKNIFQKYNGIKYISYIFMIIASCILFISFIPVDNKAIKSSAELRIKNTDISLENSNATEADSSSIAVKTFVKNRYNSVNQLISKYFTALLSNDNSELAKYSNNVENIDANKRLIWQYIESYQSIDCYTMPGMINDTYIVVATYQVKYKDSLSVVPYLDYFYICTDMSGNIYISNNTMNEEVSAYNQIMYQDNTIKELSQTVSNEYENVLKNDSKLADLINSIQRNNANGNSN